MAVTNRNSTGIANLVAVPAVINDPTRSMGGMFRSSRGVVASAADDTAASVYRFCRIPSNAIVHSVLCTAAQASTAGAISVGVYDINGGAVVNATAFVSAQSLSSAALTKSQLLSSSFITSNLEKRLWEVLGLSVDPCKEYDVSALISTTFNGGPTAIAIEVSYTV